MIVSESNKFIYTRIPKTGSTSVSQALIPFGRAADRNVFGALVRRFVPDTKMAFAVNFKAHPHWPLLAAREILSSEFFNEACKFTVVRHPVRWCFSLYNHILRNAHVPGFQRLYPDVLRDKSFDRFVESLTTNPIPPQLGMLIDTNGCLLVDAFARLENLEREIQPIFEMIGITPNIGRLNSGKYIEHSQISSTATDIIRNVYKVDFQLFGYSGLDQLETKATLNPFEKFSKLGQWLASNGDGLAYTAFARDSSYMQRPEGERWFVQ